MKTFYNNTKENDDWTRSIPRGGSKGEGEGRGEPQQVPLNEIEFSTIWLVVGDEKFPFKLGG